MAMIVYDVSVSAPGTVQEKVDKIKQLHDVGDLLRVLREYEDRPKYFDREVIAEVKSQLYDLGIMCF